MNKFLVYALAGLCFGFPLMARAQTTQPTHKNHVVRDEHSYANPADVRVRHCRSGSWKFYLLKRHSKELHC